MKMEEEGVTEDNHRKEGRTRGRRGGPGEGGEDHGKKRLQV